MNKDSEEKELGAVLSFPLLLFHSLHCVFTGIDMNKKVPQGSLVVPISWNSIAFFLLSKLVLIRMERVASGAVSSSAAPTREVGPPEPFAMGIKDGKC